MNIEPAIRPSEFQAMSEIAIPAMKKTIEMP
jgi:hypothetical protein